MTLPRRSTGGDMKLVDGNAPRRVGIAGLGAIGNSLATILDRGILGLELAAIAVGNSSIG